MSQNTFYVTTPIYYGNGVPHIGHAYASFIADALAQYRRFSGDAVKFSTGIDENSQKGVEKAREAGMTMEAYTDMMAAKHREVWDTLGITYTDFIRTTEKRHHDFVQKVLATTYDRGDIYEGEYEGLYCVGCEAFKKVTDLTPEGLCPDHLKKPEHIKEKNWFFRLSDYQERLLRFYQENPDFVLPRHRFQEVIEFLKQEKLEDLSISRSTSTFGIPLPFDPTQVTYVWYDALLNYLTVCQGGDERFWPADLHVVAKDIIRFHAVYWPAMLMSAGYPVPKQILATGYFTNEGQKISKSLGNVIDPVEFSAKFSKDLLLVYLFTSLPIGSDGDFSEREAIFCFNNRLANNVGNLLNRFLVLSLTAGGDISGTLEAEIATAKNDFVRRYESAMGRYDLREALISAFEFGDFVNKYIDTAKPWELKDPSQVENLRHVMYQVGESLRSIGLALLPFFGEKMRELLVRMGAGDDFSAASSGNLHEMLANPRNRFVVSEKGEPLYMRISVK